MTTLGSIKCHRIIERHRNLSESTINFAVRDAIASGLLPALERSAHITHAKIRRTIDCGNFLSKQWRQLSNLLHRFESHNGNSYDAYQDTNITINVSQGSKDNFIDKNIARACIHLADGRYTARCLDVSTLRDLGFKRFQSRWNLTSTAAAALSRGMSKFRTIQSL